MDYDLHYELQEVDHAIKLVHGAHHVARRPYKMFVPKSIELKKQLTQLLDQGFIQPSVSR